MRQKRSQKAKDHQNIRHSLGIPSFTWSNGRSPILNTEGVLFLLRKLLPFMEVSKITASATAAARTKIPRFKQSSQASRRILKSKPILEKVESNHKVVSKTKCH